MWRFVGARSGTVDVAFDTVERGHVTLIGVVNSEVERRKAEAIARTTFGAFSVDNKLRLDREMTTN